MAERAASDAASRGDSTLATPERGQTARDDDEIRVPAPAEMLAAGLGGLTIAAVFWWVRDLTPMPPPLYDAFAAAAVLIGLSPLAERLAGRPAGPIMRGFGIAATVLLMARAMVPPYDRATIPVAIWIAAGALLTGALRAQRASRGVLNALGYLALPAGVAVGWRLAGDFPDPARLRLAVTLALGLALVGFAARWLLRRFDLDVLAPRPGGILGGSGLIATYLAYRSLAAGRITNLPLYEWSIGVGLALLLMGRLRRAAFQHATPDAWASTARRHTQAAKPKFDDRMVPLAAVIRRQLERGDAGPAFAAAFQHAPADVRAAAQAVADARRGRRGRQARQEAYHRLQSTLEME